MPLWELDHVSPTFRICLAALAAVCLLGQALACPSTVDADGLLLEGVDETRYQITAAYPFWKAASFPVGELPWEYLDQIDHFSIHPGPGGTLAIPKGFVMPALIEQAHFAGKKVVLVVGGANSYAAFATMVANPTERVAFIENLVAFTVEQGYDGVSIDWEFPRSAGDRQNLRALMAELRTGLDRTGQVLSLNIAVTSNEKRGEWIDTESIAPLVDHFVVMTFGYYGAWGSESGHNAPLYPVPAAGDSRCVDQSLRYWAETRGVPWSKIYMGIASFGIWFDSEGLYQAFANTRKADYRDIKPMSGDGYTLHWDGAAQVPYLTWDDGPGLWSYDDPQSVGLKRDYVLANGLGGIAVWDVTMDRVGGEHELLKALAPSPAPNKALIPLVRVGK
jgi:GH18 family chitinase